MTSPEILAGGETEKLPFVLRQALQAEFLKFELGDKPSADQVADWVEKNDSELSDIVDHDEEVKALALAGKVAEAAELIKEKLDARLESHVV